MVAYLPKSRMYTSTDRLQNAPKPQFMTVKTSSSKPAWNPIFGGLRVQGSGFGVVDPRVRA